MNGRVENDYTNYMLSSLSRSLKLPTMSTSSSSLPSPNVAQFLKLSDSTYLTWFRQNSTLPIAANINHAPRLNL